MFQLSTLSVTAMIAGLSLAQNIPALYPRQVSAVPCVEQIFRKPCGSDTLCIPSTWTCCQKRQGGCSPGNVCFLDDNGNDCCCPIGRRCGGVCGAVTLIDVTTRVSTISDENTLPAVIFTTVASAETSLSSVSSATSVPAEATTADVPSSNTSPELPTPTTEHSSSLASTTVYSLETTTVLTSAPPSSSLAVPYSPTSSPALTSTTNATSTISTVSSPAVFTGAAVKTGFADSELLVAALLAVMRWVL